MHRLTLSARDTEEAVVLVDELAARFSGVEDDKFLHEAAVLAHDLPRSVRVALHEVRLDEAHGAVVVAGYPVDDTRIGPTPANWGTQTAPGSTLREEMFFFLCGALLGEAIGWRTQQTGRIMHDVLPIRGHENVQLNSASDMQIYWHVEDAFHPYRADYVGLMCLRNDDAVATTYATLDVEELPRDVRNTLFEPRFFIKPDNSHGAAAADEPVRIAVLFGDPAQPYLRLDPYFMDSDRHDPPARQALETLSRVLDARLQQIALQPGEVLFVDNFRAVHGRNSFHARYDGRDRWLKRLNITRDLRKSRAARTAAADRVIGTFDTGFQER